MGSGKQFFFPSWEWAIFFNVGAEMGNQYFFQTFWSWVAFQNFSSCYLGRRLRMTLCSNCFPAGGGGEEDGKRGGVASTGGGGWYGFAQGWHCHLEQIPERNPAGNKLRVWYV